jgi:hypothetical protein
MGACEHNGSDGRWNFKPTATRRISAMALGEGVVLRKDLVKRVVSLEKNPIAVPAVVTFSMPDGSKQVVRESVLDKLVFVITDPAWGRPFRDEIWEKHPELRIVREALSYEPRPNWTVTFLKVAF